MGITGAIAMDRYTRGNAHGMGLLQTLRWRRLGTAVVLDNVVMGRASHAAHSLDTDPVFHHMAAFAARFWYRNLAVAQVRGGGIL